MVQNQYFTVPVEPLSNTAGSVEVPLDAEMWFFTSPLGTNELLSYSLAGLEKNEKGNIIIKDPAIQQLREINILVGGS